MNHTYYKRKGRVRYAVGVTVGLLWLVLGSTLLLTQPAKLLPATAGHALARSPALVPDLFRGGVAAWTNLSAQRLNSKKR